MVKIPIYVSIDEDLVKEVDKEQEKQQRPSRANMLEVIIRKYLKDINDNKKGGHTE